MSSHGAFSAVGNQTSFPIPLAVLEYASKVADTIGHTKHGNEWKLIGY
jgi:hypothetical protein